jgi:hypothetical protein
MYYTLLKAYSVKRNLKSSFSYVNKEIGEVEEQIQKGKAITLIFKLIAITVRTNNGSCMLRAIANKAVTFLRCVKALYNNTKTEHSIIAIML